MSLNDQIERTFPALVGTGWSITSEQTPQYNCIAWAAGEDHRWWWPNAFGGVLLGGYYWPAEAPLEESLRAFEHAYQTHGYEACESGHFEAGLEKIAVYKTPEGKPTHAARQLPDGRWASKLGRAHDIEHDAAEHIEGQAYGEVAFFMSRPARSGA